MWNIDAEDPAAIKYYLQITIFNKVPFIFKPFSLERKTIVQNANKSKAAIRSVALSMNGQILIAVNDEAQVLIWRKEY